VLLIGDSCSKLSHIFLKVPPLCYFRVSLAAVHADKEFVRWFGEGCHSWCM
jgi:hypothetical protein